MERKDLEAAAAHVTYSEPGQLAILTELSVAYATWGRSSAAWTVRPH
jgi:hypothetical protein